ncbi:MAG: YaiI/YqxD family protein [Treponema sp.]
MRLFVDADSCPVRIREVVCKTGLRLCVPVVFVANRTIPFPHNTYTSLIITDTSDQAADSYIVQHSQKGDIVITRDIPLAKLLVDADILVLSDRGTVYTANNINERLSIRNFMYELHISGLAPEKTKTFGKKDVMLFAQTLDRETRRLMQPL